MMRWSWEVDGRVETAVWDDGLFVSSSFGLEILADALVASQEIVECGLLGPSRVAGFGDEVVAWGTISEALAQYCNALGFVEFIEWAECPVIPEEENDNDNSFMSKVADVLAKASFGGDRSAAGRYAAQQRWKNHKKNDAPVSWDTPTDDLEVAKATGRPISWLQYGSFPKEVQDVFDTKMAEFRDITEEMEVKRKWFTDNNLRILDAPSEDHPLRTEWEWRKLEWRDLQDRKNKNQSDMRAEAYKAGFDYAIKAGMINLEAEMCARSMYRNFVVHNYDVFNQDASSHEDRLDDAKNSVQNSPEVMIATPIEVVEKMIRGDQRFKSQFETGGSRGSYSPDGRAEQEAFAFGLHPSVNEKLRPIYGYIRKGSASYKEIIRGEVRQYGEVHFVLKPKVLDRTTFTTDDSLSQPMFPALVRKPTYLAGHPIQRYDKRYTEAQIHGGVSLDDVVKVVMPRQAAKAMIDFPTLRISLQKMGIPLELV